MVRGTVGAAESSKRFAASTSLNSVTKPDRLQNVRLSYLHTQATLVRLSAQTSSAPKNKKRCVGSFIQVDM